MDALVSIFYLCFPSVPSADESIMCLEFYLKENSFKEESSLLRNERIEIAWRSWHQQAVQRLPDQISLGKVP